MRASVCSQSVKMKTLILAVVTLFAIGGHVQAEAPKCPMTKTGQCAADACNAYYFCPAGTAAGADATRRTCLDSTPFCNVRAGGDLCLNTNDKSHPKCATVVDPYKCAGNGYFPDPLNCRQYHICYDNDHAGSECPQGYYYNSATKSCVKHSTICYTVDCSKQSTDFAPYQPNGQFYVDCYDNKLDDTIAPVIYRCAAGELYDINQGCQFKCPKSGKVAHEVKTKYYNCPAAYAMGTVVNCPGGSTFNPSTGLCNVNFLLKLKQQEAAKAAAQKEVA